MKVTTIKIDVQTKREIDKFRQSKNESYEEIIKKLLFIVRMLKRHPILSKKTLREIELARQRIKKGNFYTEEEMRNRLNLD